MHTHNLRFRLASAIAIAGLLLAPLQPLAAFAQEPQGSDPPARVGRLAELNGAVSYHPQDDSQWTPATVNYPVKQGDAFWTEPNVHAVIEVSASRMVMAPETELDVATLTDTAFQATEPQGELYLRVRPARQDETYAVQTPRGLATLTAPGRYAVAAGDTEHPTIVTVVEGSARFAGPGVSLDVAANQAATVSGTDTFTGEVGPAQRDAFLTAVLSSERPPQPQGAAPPPTVAQLPGGDDLTQYGAWSEAPGYGEAWYPQVAADWVPYRDGTWAYVEPWGWTWVDNEPWGFAPFHYGRWVQIDGRWAWVPDNEVGTPAPVYAPALVTFFGIGVLAGAAGIGAALAEGRVGWCPLGPREPFVPWYRASDAYFRRINVGPAAINRGVPLNGFVNRAALTVVPAGVLAASRPVGPAFQRLDPEHLAQARPLVGQQPLHPTPATIGVTPVVARQLNLPPSSGLHAIAPGPPVRATPAGIVAPALHSPQPPMVPGAAGIVRPLIEAPALRTPPAPGQIGPPTIERGSGFVGQGPVPHPPPPVVNQGPVPAAITHEPPQLYRAPGAIFQQSQPPPVFHPAPPMVHPPLPAAVPAAPPPAAHPPPPPPAPQFRAAAPRPVEHGSPPAQNGQHKRPGEP